MNYRHILQAITKRLNDRFSFIDIYAESQPTSYDMECFVVSLIPNVTKVTTRIVDRVDLSIEIKYYQQNSGTKMECYNKLNVLQYLFNREFEVNGGIVHISNIDQVILKDEVSYVLTYLIDAFYFIEVDEHDLNADNTIGDFTDKKEVYELIKEVHTNKKIEGDD